MKVFAYSITAGAVALSATVLALPKWYKRIANAPKVFQCFKDGIITGEWPADCVAAAAIDVGIVKNIELGEMLIDFTLPDPIISSSQLTVSLDSITSFIWPVTDTAQHATIVFDSNDVATFDTPSSSASVTNGIVSTMIQKTSLKIKPSLFGPFVQALLSQSEVPFRLRGSVDAILKTNNVIYPTLKISGVGFNSPSKLKGCANFPNVVFEKQVSLTFDSAKGTYTLVALINIPNISQLVFILGDITFQLFDKPDLVLVVGTVFIEKMVLKINGNSLKVTIEITNKPTYDALIIGPVTFTVKGFVGSSSNPVLEGLQTFNILLTIPKLTPAA